MPSPFHVINDFLDSDWFQRLFTSKDRKRIFMITYAHIDGFSDSSYPFSNGLIFLECGYYRPRNILSLLTLFFQGPYTHRLDQRRARETFLKIAPNDRDMVNTNVVFVYAGVAEFNEPLKYAKKFAKKGIDVWIVTSSCDPGSQREDLLRDAVNHDGIKGIIVTAERGGHTVMSKIMHSLTKR